MLNISSASNAAAVTYNFITPPLAWFGVRVKPNCEKKSAAALEARGFEAFLPTYMEMQQWSDRVKLAEFPFFAGYLFCRLDQGRRSPVLSTPGVIGIVSCGSQLLPVSEEEIESVRRAVSGSTPVQPWPYLEAGHKVRVTHGLLTGVEGVVVEESNNCRLVLQVHLLQHSISLQIDRDWIKPVGITVHKHA